MSVRVLVVDDDERVLRTFSRNLSLIGYIVLTAANGQDALQLYEREQPDIALVDVRMPLLDGFGVLQSIRQQDGEAEVILVTGHGDMDMAIEALRAGASDFVPKPVNQLILEAALRRAEERLRLKRELSAARAALQQYSAELEIRNAELDAFAHTVAHSLRNPLTLVIGLAELLLRNNVEMAAEKRAHHLDNIAQSAHKMNHTVEGLLLLAGVRKAMVEMGPLNMAVIVDHVMARVAHLVDGSGATVTLPSSWPLAVGYAPWVEEVWDNYASNALKYGGRPPQVELGWDVSAGAGMIRFWVRDSGPGIAAADQSRLFVPFVRLNQVGGSGHGLGLSIVRQIVDKIGGEVGVESAPGQGSRFWFTLPAAER